jgi:hypothetical protein
MKKYYYVSYIFVLLLCSVLVGCATLFQGGPDHIPVNSNPLGAKIYLDNQLIGVSPTTISVPRKSECVIRIEMAGYESITIDRDKNLNGWFLGNILLGGIVGIAVDLITHNQGGYSDEPVMVELKLKTVSGETKTKMVMMKPVIDQY